MTSVPGHPGLSAAVLYQEELDDGPKSEVRHYFRIKILNDSGKEYANVEINFVRGDDEKKVRNIVGRTIHADGTILPFTGEPFQRTKYKNRDVKVQQIVFALPNPEVGSILEYSYVTNYSYYFEAPTWFVQSELYVLEAQYEWIAATADSFSSPLRAISWQSQLPPDTSIERTFSGRVGVFIDGKNGIKTPSICS